MLHYTNLIDEAKCVFHSPTIAAIEFLENLAPFVHLSLTSLSDILIDGTKLVLLGQEWVTSNMTHSSHTLTHFYLTLTPPELCINPRGFVGVPPHIMKHFYLFLLFLSYFYFYFFNLGITVYIGRRR